MALATYVAGQLVVVLVMRHHADTSPGGIAWLALTFVAMLMLARAKRQTGEATGNPVLLSEARVTLVDAWLAASVLTGVILNAVAGWWWADPLSAAVIVYYGAREGAHAWHEGTEAEHESVTATARGITNGLAHFALR